MSNAKAKKPATPTAPAVSSVKIAPHPLPRVVEEKKFVMDGALKLDFSQLENVYEIKSQHGVTVDMCGDILMARQTHKELANRGAHSDIFRISRSGQKHRMAPVAGMA